MKKILLSLMIVIGIGTVSAADYVDEINNASTAAVGQRVIYEMNVGEFTQAGTFAAAQQQLGELKTLGVDVVWLMPIYPRGSSKSPYAVMDFEGVNSSYGTIDDLKAFVAAAHQKNMKVILDWVPNQTANEHPWKTQHPAWYTGEHSYQDISDLNYDNADLTAEMTRIMKQWIDRCDIDGFRCDFVTHTKPSYWLSANKELKDYAAGKGKDDLILLAEVDSNDDTRFNNKTNNIGFTYDYAWWLQETVLQNGFAKNNNVTALKSNLQKFVSDSKTLGLTRMVYLTNHDQNFNDGGKTLATQYGNHRYALTVLSFTLYGMPLIYNSQEIGGTQVLNYFSDTKINWNNVDNKMRNTIRTLTALKHGVPALSDNVDVKWLTTSNSNVLAYSRKQGTVEVVVVLNLSSSAANVSVSGLTAGEYSQWLNSATIAQGTSRQQQTIAATQTFDLDANGYRVLVNESSEEEDNTDIDTYVPVLDSESEISLFFETPTETTYSVWAWDGRADGSLFVNNGWPGDAMTLKGQTSDGKYIYKFAFTKTADIPTNFIISRNMGIEEKVFDGPVFVNHGYYIEGASGNPDKIITTVITNIHDDAIFKNVDNSSEYTIDGMPATGKHHKGLFVRGGKKYLRR